MLDESPREVLEQMWCHVRMNAAPARPMESSQKRRRRLGAMLCAAALLAAAVPAIAAGSTVFDTPSQMSLSFSRGSARLLGRDALVPVRCAGSRSGTCNGTVTLSAGGRKHEVPFAVVGGSGENLTVPIGSHHAASALAVAKTVQPAGGYVRSSEVLRFR
jgi:hypothetical protein